MLWALAWLVLAAAGLAPAQELPWGVVQEDPVWLHYVPQLKYIKTEAEGRQSSYKLANGAPNNSNDIAVRSGIGLTWRNYIYHPALLNYFLVFEPEYRWQRRKETSNSGSSTELTLNGTATLNLLSAKPYATSISIGRSHDEVQADFFSSQSVDSQFWSVLSGYRAGAVPVTLNVEQSKVDREGFNGSYTTDQFRVGLHAVNERKNGAMSVMDYQFNRYQSRSGVGGGNYSSESSSHSVQLTDKERFKKSTLSSSLYFNERESRGSSSSDLNGFINYNLNLTPNLANYYTYSTGAHFGNGSNSVQHNVGTGISHQLYESLASKLEVHASNADSHSDTAKLKSLGYGLAASLDYTKKLGDGGHLSLSNSFNYDLLDQEVSGNELIINGESYTLPATGPLIIRLKVPGDLAITSIFKNNVPLDANEWLAITTGDPWQIQFFRGGAHVLTNGDTVIITYVVRPNPTGKNSIRTIVNGIAFRFWQGQAGVRASYRTTENQANSPGFVVQDIKQYELGADVGWKGARVDATYNNRRYALYSYRSYIVNESYSRPLSPSSTAGFSLYQQRYDYSAGGGSTSNSSENFTFYSYMFHYDWHSTGQLSLNGEAGLQQQRGTLQNQNRFAARLHLDWRLGKLEIHLGYEHENNQYVRDVYRRHYAFLRMRRNF